MNIVKQIRRMMIPPCSKCASSYEDRGVLRCTNQRGLELLEKLTGDTREESMLCERVRATKYCDFEERDAS